MKTTNLTLLMFCMGFSASTQAADSHARVIGSDTTVTFDTKQAVLTPDSKEKLRTLVKEARAKGPIAEIQVAVWSDNPAPRIGEELSKSDRKLAEHRANVLNQYLKQRSSAKIQTYNMAEGSSWLARTFQTDSAELKSEIGRGGDAPMSTNEFQVFKNHGQPSKAVVLVVMKHRE